MIIGQYSWKTFWVLGLVENGAPAVIEHIVFTYTQKKHIENHKLKDLKAKNYLFQALDRSISETTLNKDTAKKKTYGILWSRNIKVWHG